VGLAGAGWSGPRRTRDRRQKSASFKKIEDVLKPARSLNVWDVTRRRGYRRITTIGDRNYIYRYLDIHAGRGVASVIKLQMSIYTRRDNRRDQLQGTLDLLVLRTLSTGGTMHGYAIAERVEQVSGDTLHIEFGSLYPALHRMEESGWVKSSWAASNTNRQARFYTLTAKGRKRLAEEEDHWARLVGAVGRVLREA
jgi:transcriptional regulator